MSGTLSEMADRVTALERERDELRDQLEIWRWEATEARRELKQIQTSRVWKLAHLYWALRRRLRSTLRRLSPSSGRVTSAPGAPQEGPARTEAAVVSHRLAVPPGLPRVPSGRFDVLVLSIIDWDFRFQRPQQLATQLGAHGHRVFYLSTTEFLPADGPPARLSWKADRVVEVALRARRPLDIYGGRLEEEDVVALEASLGELLEELAMGDVVALVQIPFWTPLAMRLRERFGWRIVYDCMDEWASFPGIGEAVTAQEERLVTESDLTLATARRLHDKLSARALRSALVPNGVDLDHYRRHYVDNDLLGPVGSPVIGYYGALAPWVDVPLLEKIALRFPEATLVLAGGVFDLDLSRLEALPNVRLLGQRPYDEMPKLLRHFDVCIIPFLLNEITQATNPVKLYEYLSSGKPVVAPPMSELLPFATVCELGEGHPAFLAGVERALAEPLEDPRREQRCRLAEQNDWRHRYATLASAVAECYPLVSVVIVTYGGLPLTRRCLESLRRETWPRLEVLVVDNASTDGTPELLRSCAAEDARVRVLLQERNLGFPTATNRGIAEATGEILLLLNNDTVVPPGMIGRLVRHLERDPGIGILCPTTNFCGNEARVEPDYEQLDELPRYAAVRARRYAGRVLELPMAAMYCVALRREVVEEIGPLDEAFGIGMFEDDDYSCRIRQAGYRVACAEDAYVHHVGQAAFRALSAQEYQELWERNQTHYERKWGRSWQPHAMRAGVSAVASKVGRP